MSHASPSFSRRRIGLWLMGSFAALSTRPVRAAESDKSVTVDWVMPREQVELVNGVLKLGGEQIRGVPGSAEDTKGLPLLYVILGAVVVVALAEAILSIYRDAKYGGVSVDASSGKFVVQSNLAIPPGTVLIKDRDGQVRVHELPPKGALLKLTELLLAAMGKQ